MVATQITLIQIDNYGPWTVTPEPRREVDLQTLQSRLYADLSQLFGNRDGYVFFTRFDNMIAVTNGVDVEAHRQVQGSVRNRYPVTISFGVATDPSPAAALTEATMYLQDAGSAQEEDRTEILRGDPLPEDERGSDDVRIAHFDVNDATQDYTDRMNAFEVFRRIDRGYLTLLDYMYEENDSLSFFVGGDNVISVNPDLDRGDYRRAIDHVQDRAGIDLKVGVGSGTTAREAGSVAKHALERCREEGSDVEIGAGEPAEH